MHVHSRYRAKKFRQGGAVICDTGEVLVMRPPPEAIGNPEEEETVPGMGSDSAKPAPQDEDLRSLESALETAAKYSGGTSMPSLRDEALVSQEDSWRSRPPTRHEMGQRVLAQAYRDSREVPSSTGRRDRPGSITLTAEQKSAAKIAGISEVEYCRQLIRLKEAKANGDYLESR
jgi:hypothetical protein